MLMMMMMTMEEGGIAVYKTVGSANMIYQFTLSLLTALLFSLNFNSNRPDPLISLASINNVIPLPAYLPRRPHFLRIPSLLLARRPPHRSQPPHSPSILPRPLPILALLLSVAGVSVGIPLAHLLGYSISANAHTIIGLAVVFSLLAFQPIGGWLQHRYNKRYAGRGVQGTLHVWFGRAIIVLGIVNGGLGLQMAGDTGLDRARAYVGVAATIGVLYGIVLIWNVWSTKSVRDVVALPWKVGEKGEKRGGRYGDGDG
jgi:hypothetical protein